MCFNIEHGTEVQVVVERVKIALKVNFLLQNASKSAKFRPTDSFFN
jgi:hypothetical protein